MEAMLGGVQRYREGEEGEYDEAGPCAERWDPLAHAKREYGRYDGKPDKYQAEEILPTSLHGCEEGIRRRLRYDQQRASNPYRDGDPVKNGGYGGSGVTERILRPEETTAFPGESRAKFGCDQAIWHEEGKGQKDQPGEPLCSTLCGRTDRIDTHKSANEKEENVEAPKVFSKLALLSTCVGIC